MSDLTFVAYELAQHYREQALGLGDTDQTVNDLVVRDLRQRHGVSLPVALRLASSALKEGGWGTLEDEKPAYREDNPYWFKWAFNNRTGEPHVWRCSAGGDGKPTHRQMYESQGWNRVEDQLALGQAIYKPAERKMDKTVIEPAEIRVLYYPNTTTFVPEPIIGWFTNQFPEAFIHTAEFTSGGLRG